MLPASTQRYINRELIRVRAVASSIVTASTCPAQVAHRARTILPRRRIIETSCVSIVISVLRFLMLLNCVAASRFALQ